MDGKKKTYGSVLAGEPCNDEWYTLSFPWQVLFYWGWPNKTFTLLSLVFSEHFALFECEMATQTLLTHRGVFAHASVSIEAEMPLPFAGVTCYPLPEPTFTFTSLSRTPRQLSSSRRRWCLLWKLLRAVPAAGKGKIEMVIAAVREGQHCHVLQPLALLSTSRACWQQAALPTGGNEEQHLPISECCIF